MFVCVLLSYSDTFLMTLAHSLCIGYNRYYHNLCATSYFEPTITGLA